MWDTLRVGLHRWYTKHSMNSVGHIVLAFPVRSFFLSAVRNASNFKACFDWTLGFKIRKELAVPACTCQNDRNHKNPVPFLSHQQVLHTEEVLLANMLKLFFRIVIILSYQCYSQGALTWTQRWFQNFHQKTKKLITGSSKPLNIRKGRHCLYL